jgi:hypothetical protein
MPNLRLWNRQKHLPEIELLETKLKGLLVPVRPRAEYLNDVKERLRQASGTARMSIGSHPLPNTPIWVLMLAGLASIVIFLLAGIRAAIAVLGALGLVTQLNKDLPNKARKISVRSHR